MEGKGEEMIVQPESREVGTMGRVAVQRRSNP
jgi:hypothetical protein